MNESIAQNLLGFKSHLPEEVTLVAVSKTKPVSDLMKAYDSGQRIFGENKVQEMTSKWEVMPKDIQWHMIGHLQTNKVKYIASFVGLIHSLDRLKLAKEINRQGERHRKIIDCLVQIKIAKEEEKYGFSMQEAFEFLSDLNRNPLPFVRIRGVMGMATFTADQQQIKDEFALLEDFYLKHQKTFGFEVLSMGMSGDYTLALDHGSNMIRVGSAIFGSRTSH